LTLSDVLARRDLTEKIALPVMVVVTYPWVMVALPLPLLATVPLLWVLLPMVLPPMVLQLWELLPWATALLPWVPLPWVMVLLLWALLPWALALPPWVLLLWVVTLVMDSLLIPAMDMLLTQEASALPPTIARDVAVVVPSTPSENQETRESMERTAVIVTARVRPPGVRPALPVMVLENSMLLDARVRKESMEKIVVRVMEMVIFRHSDVLLVDFSLVESIL